MALKPMRVMQTEDRLDRFNFKLTQEDKLDMFTQYMLNGPRAVEPCMKKYKICKQTFYKVLKDEKVKENFNMAVGNLDARFATKCTLIIERALGRIAKELDDESKDVDVSKLATLTGILYDKSRLEKGMSTQNKSINVNIKVD